jgi:hypothetical protein
MPNVYITLECEDKQIRDLAVPLDVPSRILCKALVKALDQEGTFEESFSLLEERPEGTRQIPAEATLGDAEIYNGTRLKLISEHNLKSQLKPPVITCIVLPDGREIPLTDGLTKIGRTDIKHNILPDLDLTEFDTMKISSRKHAIINGSQNNYTITDESSSNGTFLNDQRLEVGQPMHLKDGDTISFGRNGVRVKFKRG